jgi:transcriptional regulator with XRE-family HTH domain
MIARMKPHQVRALLQSAGLTQAEAGHLIDITDRQMRRYVSGETKVPRVVMLALLHVIEQRRKEATK